MTAPFLPLIPPMPSHPQSVGLVLSLLVLIDLEDEVALVECPVHQEILRGVVGEHDECPAEVCFDLVELQEA